jgi:lactate dehydrogenase-like 2-hydroxyacid dehydrogenase
MPTIFVTRRIPEVGLTMLREKGYTLDISGKDGVLTREELLAALRAKPYDGLLSLLTDTIDEAVFAAAPSVRVIANYAVGFNNIDIKGASARGIVVTNTPGALSDTVAEHALALILAIVKRVVEADRFVREGKFDGWGPMLFLGMDLKGKILGILGAGRIGSRLAYQAQRGFDMKVIYYDIKRNEAFEAESGATYYKAVEDVLERSDVVSIHVPLLDSTRHLINAASLRKMKPSAYLVNTSRGPVIDEPALVDALRSGTIAGAALDVFENEPALAPGLADLPNVVLTPHIASASLPTREEMSRLAAENLIAFFEGKTPPNVVA